MSKSGTVVIFTNQIRMKIGIMFGNPETTPGGNALKFFSSVRLDIRRRAQLKSGEEIVGNRVAVKVVKNKVAAPFRTAEFDIMYNEGISRVGDIIQTGVRYGVIEKAGAWYSYGGEKMGQGIDGAKEYMKKNPKLEKKLMDEIKKAVQTAAEAKEE